MSYPKRKDDTVAVKVKAIKNDWSENAIFIIYSAEMKYCALQMHKKHVKCSQPLWIIVLLNETSDGFVKMGTASWKTVKQVEPFAVKRVLVCSTEWQTALQIISS